MEDTIQTIEYRLSNSCLIKFRLYCHSASVKAEKFEITITVDSNDYWTNKVLFDNRKTATEAYGKIINNVNNKDAVITLKSYNSVYTYTISDNNIKLHILSPFAESVNCFYFEKSIQKPKQEVTHEVAMEDTGNDDEKVYYSYNAIHRIIEKTSNTILQHFKPDYIIAIAGGGCIPARLCRSYIKVPIITVGFVLYKENGEQEGKPVITQWFDEINKQNIKGKKVLIVDEINDTAKTLSCCIKELWKCDVEDIGVMVIHHKKKPKLAKLAIPPENYFVGEEIDGNVWVNYIWESRDIDAFIKKTEGK